MSPKVSCLMANYNTNKDHLKLAIDSILKQSYQDFELIIVDDKSTDDSLQVLKDYQKTYPQIKIIENKENSGLAYCLNKAIDLAQGDYIARMDTDDISLKDRFKKQVAYLNSHPDIHILGTFAKEFDQGDEYKFLTFTKKDDTRALLLFTNCLFHPTVMIRKDFLEKTGLRYDPNFKTSQDYDLWARASLEGNIEVLEEVLLFYRIHGGQVTDSKKEKVKKYTKDISLRQVGVLGLKAEKEDLEAHLALARLIPITEKNLDQVFSWANKIIEANNTKKIYLSSSLKRVLNFRLTSLIAKADLPLKKKLSAMRKIKAFNSFNLSQVFKRISYKKDKGKIEKDLV